MNGHPEAAVYMGLAYDTGIGKMVRDEEKAQRYYLQAEKGNAALEKVLLGASEYKKNALGSKKAAIKYFQAAAKQGNSLAKAFLQQIDEQGTEAKLDFMK